MLRIETTEAATGEFDPRVIWFGTRRVEVRAVSDRWYGKARRWWKVETDEGAYVLRYDESGRNWELAAIVAR